MFASLYITLELIGICLDQACLTLSYVSMQISHKNAATTTAVTPISLGDTQTPSSYVTTSLRVWLLVSRCCVIHHMLLVRAAQMFKWETIPSRLA